MNKWFFIAAFAILLLPNGFAETIFERSFAEMGYEDFTVEGAMKTGCREISFLFPEETGVDEASIYPIASLAVKPGPVQQGKMDVNAYLNGKLFAGLKAEDFKCREETCWERLSLPKSLLEEEENSLKVCMGTGNTITRLVLGGQSAVGLYKAADFSGENSFRMVAEKTELVIGEKTTIKILLHNKGSADSLAEIKFARPLAEDKNAFSVVEGYTYFTGIVEAGQTVEISYVIKPRLAVTMTLPPAIVYFDNGFSEKDSKFSNLVSLDVREPDRKIEAFIVNDEEAVFAGQSIGMKIAVKNVGNDPLYNLRVEISSDAGISQPEKTIESIPPKETRYLAFSASSPEAGKFPVECKVTYVDLNVFESPCQKAFIEFKTLEIGPAIYAGIALIIVAVIVYALITRT